MSAHKEAVKGSKPWQPLCCIGCSTGTGSFDVTAVKVTFASPAQYDSTATVTVVLTDANGKALAMYAGRVSRARFGLASTHSSKLPVEAVSNVAVAVEGKHVTASTAK